MGDEFFDLEWRPVQGAIRYECDYRLDSDDGWGGIDIRWDPEVQPKEFPRERCSFDSSLPGLTVTSGSTYSVRVRVGRRDILDCSPWTANGVTTQPVPAARRRIRCM